MKCCKDTFLPELILMVKIVFNPRVCNGWIEIYTLGTFCHCQTFSKYIALTSFTRKGPDGRRGDKISRLGTSFIE